MNISLQYVGQGSYVSPLVYNRQLVPNDVVRLRQEDTVPLLTIQKRNNAGTLVNIFVAVGDGVAVQHDLTAVYVNSGYEMSTTQVTSEQLVTPSSQMLANVKTIYQRVTAPFDRWQSDGIKLSRVGGSRVARKMAGSRQWNCPQSVGSAGTANTTWHRSISGSRPFSAVQLAFMNLSTNTDAIYENISVCSPAGMSDLPNPAAGNSAWVNTPSLTVPFKAGIANPYHNRVWTPRIELASKARNDGGIGTLLSMRVHNTGTIPAYYNTYDAALWNGAYALDGINYCASQVGNFATTNQSAFAPGAGHDIAVIPAVRFFYDTPGKTVMLLGDSIPAGMQVEAGVARGQSAVQRAIFDLQMQGVPVDLVTTAISGQDFDEGWIPPFGGDTFNIDFFQPEIIIVPTFTPNQSPATLDANWARAMRAVEYAQSRPWAPEVVLMQAFPHGGTAAYMTALRARVAASGLPVIDPAPYVSTMNSGGNAWTWIGGVGGAMTPDGTHPLSAANIAVKDHAASVLRALI